jgi:hypothetical protein
VRAFARTPALRLQRSFRKKQWWARQDRYQCAFALQQELFGDIAAVDTNIHANKYTRFDCGSDELPKRASANIQAESKARGEGMFTSNL